MRACVHACCGLCLHVWEGGREGEPCFGLAPGALSPHPHKNTHKPTHPCIPHSPLPRRFTILDDAPVGPRDLANNFFVTQHDVGKPRAEVGAYVGGSVGLIWVELGGWIGLIHPPHGTDPDP